MSTNDREHRVWIERLSDYMDGGLSAEEHRRAEEHLSECGACRRILEDLREVVQRAGALGPIEPPRDLWDGIAGTIKAPQARLVSGSPTKIIAFPGADRVPTAPPERTRTGFTLTRGQLVAASVVLIAASSMATWMVGPGLGAGPVAEIPAAAESTGSVTMAAEVAAPPEELAAELAQVEETLREARRMLDPNTVRVLERNLGVIERAIADSRNALAQDPGNEFLAEHLERVYERKLTYLRDVVRVAEWTG
jgi:anti-sigma factor RsiW